MAEALEVLRRLDIFEALNDEEIERLAMVASERSFAVGELLYSRGDDPDGMYIILDGAVELVSGFAGGVERVFGTLRSGQVFGFLSLIDRGPRPATARAVEPTRTMIIDRAVIDGIHVDNPTIWAKIVSGLGEQMASQIRSLVELYRQCVEWGLEVSGCAGINLDRLLAGSVRIEVELLNGSLVTGVIVGVEKDPEGYELLVRSNDGKLRIIPGHAVLQIMAAPADLGPVLAE